MNKGLGKWWNAYCVILIVQTLNSLYPWFMWWVPSKLAIYVQFLIAVFFFLVTPYFWDFKNIKKWFAAALLLAMYFYQTAIEDGVLNYFIQQGLSAFTLIPLVMLKRRHQIDLLEKFQRVMTMILTVSLLFWIGHLVGFDLPSIDVTYGTKETDTGVDAQYYFSNHFLYLVNQAWMINSYDFLPSNMRFSSVFLEPGYLSILMVFFLFINRFSFREKRNIVFLITIIASFSLAGFLLALFAFMAHIIRDSKRRVPGIIAFVVVVNLGGLFFQNYNDGDNIINEGLIQRLKYDQSSGNLAGYNRTTVVFDDYYDAFIKSNNSLFGIGYKGLQREFGGASNVGYKVFIVKYGILGLALFLLFLLALARVGHNYQSFVLMLLYIIMFIRGDVTMFWHAFILVYVCGIAQSISETISHEKNRNRCTIQRV